MHTGACTSVVGGRYPPIIPARSRHIPQEQAEWLATLAKLSSYRFN